MPWLKQALKRTDRIMTLKNILTGGRSGKFANTIPCRQKMNHHFQNSWNFVQATKENEMTTDSVEENISVKEGNV